MNSVLTVTQLNRYISFRFKEDSNLKGKLVRGEISNFTHHIKTGHMYFTLKDKESSIKAIMFNSYAGNLHFRPENGMDVIVMASIQVFERDGVYQLYATDMQPSGIGALYLAFEQMKEKLSAEGLFASEHKQPIPAFPKKIGVVTAQSGAALQDILTILSRRYPIAEVLLFPALVQGEDAPQSICKAIGDAGSTDCDVLIVGRGGGSLEDLSAFNSELVARAIFDSNIPIISAVGHETDVTIADFVADLRAPTPSAAAELAVPDSESLYKMLEQSQQLLYERALKLIELKQRNLDTMVSKFSALSIEQKLEVTQISLKTCVDRLNKAVLTVVSEKESVLKERLAQLEAMDPFKVMYRGYSLVYKDSRLIRTSAEVQEDDVIQIQLSTGEISAVVKQIFS